MNWPAEFGNANYVTVGVVPRQRWFRGLEGRPCRVLPVAVSDAFSEDPFDRAVVVVAGDLS